MEIQPEKSSTYHCSCSCLVHLVLSCLDFGLQVCRGMKVLAFLPRASTFDVIHANCNSIFICVYHCNIYRVSIAAIILTTCAISTLKLSTNLKRKSHCWAEHQVTLHLVFSTQNISSVGHIKPCVYSKSMLILCSTYTNSHRGNQCYSQLVQGTKNPTTLPRPITKCKRSTEFAQNGKWPQEVNVILAKLLELRILSLPLKLKS